MGRPGTPGPPAPAPPPVAPLDLSPKLEAHSSNELGGIYGNLQARVPPDMALKPAAAGGRAAASLSAAPGAAGGPSGSHGHSEP